MPLVTGQTMLYNSVLVSQVCQLEQISNTATILLPSLAKQNSLVAETNDALNPNAFGSQN